MRHHFVWFAADASRLVASMCITIVPTTPIAPAAALLASAAVAVLAAVVVVVPVAVLAVHSIAKSPPSLLLASLLLLWCPQ